MTPPLPSFFSHLSLLWRMRLAAAANDKKTRGVHPALAHLPALLPAVVLAVLAHELMVHPAVAGFDVLSRFFLGLICFVAALVWCLWPVLSAGVDDHSELSRFVAFPISRVRLLVASTLSGLLEPIALIVYAPVMGAAVGYGRVHGLSSPLLAAALFISFVLMCAFWSRVGLHLVLGVLRSKRSAEALGGFLLVIVALGLVLPPVDTSWLYGEGGGFGAIDTRTLSNAAVALGRVPPGYLAEGLRHLSEGHWVIALLELFGLLLFAGIGLVTASALLPSASRAAAGLGGGSKRRALRGGFAGTSSRFGALVLREALDLIRNPRARLLVGVPFVLGVLFRLLSGRDLFEHLLGPAADAWLMGGMVVYGAVLMLSTFAQNAFAYDSHGLRLLLASPVPAAEVLRSKNVVHGAAAFSLGALIAIFYSLYLGRYDPMSILMSMGVLLTLVPVGLSAGNFLSVRFPVKFHAGLQRRDKPPLASAALGLFALAFGASILPASMALGTEGGPGISSLVLLLGGASIAWGAYGMTFPVALASLHARREHVLCSVTRS